MTRLSGRMPSPDFLAGSVSDGHPDARGPGSDCGPLLG